jgi:hypothetical protein
MNPRRALLSAGLALAIASGCGPKLVRETIYDRDGVHVELRRSVKGGSPVARGYEHPATLAAVRVAHIFALIHYEDSKGAQHPTIRSEHVYPLGEGVAQALAKAGPDDEIAVAVFAVDRHLGVFQHKRVTAFRASMLNDELVLEFYSVNALIERGGPRGSEYKIPEEVPSWKPDFRLVPGEAQRQDGPRVLRVEWRNSYFARPPSLRLRDGQLQRRTILMEEELPVEPESLKPPSTALRDAQMQALDQIDAARRSGLISESEYRRRRRLVLEGRLEEAGYGTKPEE